jgi:hypothetical protein
MTQDRYLGRKLVDWGPLTRSRPENCPVISVELKVQVVGSAGVVGLRGSSPEPAD